jgi:hypothetical protein
MCYSRRFMILLSLFGASIQSLAQDSLGNRQQNGPAILSGYCYGNSGLLQGLFFGLGANHDSACYDGLNAADTTGSQNTGLPMPSAGTLRNLTLVAYEPTSPPAPPSYQVAIQVWVNSAPTALSCMITVAVINQAIKCTDNIHSVSVKAGDTITIMMTATPNNGTAVTMNVALEKGI